MTISSTAYDNFPISLFYIGRIVREGFWHPELGFCNNKKARFNNIEKQHERCFFKQVGIG
jgi:hypothetical protein